MCRYAYSGRVLELRGEAAAPGQPLPHGVVLREQDRLPARAAAAVLQRDLRQAALPQDAARRLRQLCLHGTRVRAGDASRVTFSARVLLED